MMCSYPPSSGYPDNAQISGSENWSINSNQSYGVGDTFVQNEHHRRWLAQQNSEYARRESRGDVRGRPSQTRSLPQQLPVQQNFSSSGYLGSAQAPRPSSFPNPNARDSVVSSNSNWVPWDMDTEPPLLSGTRFNNGPSSWNNQQLNVQIPQFTQPFSDMLYSSSDSSSATLFTPPSDQAIPLNGYAFPHRFSPGLSPSPSPVHHGSTTSTSSSSQASHSRRQSEDRSDTGKSCSHCHATSTPLWRRDPSTMKPLCNACGLYLQQRNKLRPQELIDADDDGSTSDESDVNYVGPECSHCRTHHTSVWRRSKTGEQLCNACGVYLRLRGKPRPLSLKRNKIRPRSKHLPK
ncbi:Trans-acting T-cell-specific transcription factor GATA-3 [Psilocybe cubensis]|uniref:GATA-type domain-containing protein n=2 Tax=Psilocybe cubensis TaxID=181762 RepID=A0A8H8CL39_PSICU|nr:Trans-acting T-cell-specific transcription factor GATA-3 [Psilocybe cubensis]KAH9482110.1 Trans-acting T-cell-specific transcription factor GATA-3 [Psilocybe cubensis]